MRRVTSRPGIRTGTRPFTAGWTKSFYGLDQGWFPCVPNGEDGFKDDDDSDIRADGRVQTSINTMRCASGSVKSR